MVELKGYAPWRRAKSVEYRIIYKIDGDILCVALVGKHNDDEVYHLIERFLRQPIYLVTAQLSDFAMSKCNNCNRNMFEDFIFSVIMLTCEDENRKSDT